MNANQRNDLLLEALSHIDDDILARGLALREKDILTARASAIEPPKATDKTDTAPLPLMDLSDLDPKPPRPNRWRAAVIALAAALLLALLPVCGWLVARQASDGTDGERESYTSNSEAEITLDDYDKTDGNGVGTGHMSPSQGAEAETAPVQEGESNREEPVEDAETTFGGQGNIGVVDPFEDETAAPYEPSEFVWNTASAWNGQIKKEAYSADTGRLYTMNAVVDTFVGSQAELDAFMNQTVSPEDELVLELFGQWCCSLYGFDYGAHFQLFQYPFVRDRFLSQLSDEDMTLSEAIVHINRVAGDVVGYGDVALEVSLAENELLTGGALEDYLDQEAETFSAAGLSSGRITAVRRFTVEGHVVVEDTFRLEDWSFGNEFYCYEYDGVWYMDCSFLDDDLSVDLALCDIGADHYYQTKTVTGTVTAVDDEYLYVDGDTAFKIDGADIYAQTDNSEWESSPVNKGATVTVTYYTLGFVGYGYDEGSEVNIYCAVEVRVIG